MDFMSLIDPSTSLGAFVISMLASLFVGFISGKQYEKYISKKTINIQKNRIVEGNANVGCTTIKKGNGDE